MARHRQLILLLGFLLTGTAIGCNDAAPRSPKKVAPPPTASKESPPRARFSQDELAGLGGYLPELDDGRIKIAPPANWDVLPRDKDYVVRFALDRNSPIPLPRITVKVAEATFDEPADLDEDSLAAFRDFVAESLDEKTRRVLVDDLSPMVLGDVPCVRYVVAKRFKRGQSHIHAHSEVIKTLFGGRIYTLSLDHYEHKLIDYRSEAYAVMAGMQFLSPAEEGSAQCGDQ